LNSEAAISASGDIKIYGIVKGNGTLSSGRDIIIETGSDLTSELKQLALYADRDIMLTYSLKELLDLNYDTAINGVICAKRNITIDPSGADVGFKGTIYAETGNLNINSARNVWLNFVPDKYSANFTLPWFSERNETLFFNTFK